MPGTSAATPTVAGVLSLVNCLANLLTVYSALYLMNVMAACPLDAQVRPIFSAIFNPVQF